MKAKLIALLAVLVLGGGIAVAAIGGDEKQESTAAALAAAGGETAATNAGGIDSGASELRSGLTALLQEHVYLAGTAVSTGASKGLDSKEFEAAAGTLDGNSVALSEAIGSVYGDAAGEQFLALWRDHIGFFVDYTKAKAEGDRRGVQAARDKLDGSRAEFGAFIASANPNLTEEAVAEELKPHVDSVFDAIDAVVAGDADVYDKLREAAAHMPATAEVLAGAIVKQMPEKFEG